MFQIWTGLVAQADLVTDRPGQRPADDQHQHHQRDEHDRDEGDQQHDRAQLPEGPPFADLVDPVHGAAERADVAGRRPQRERGTEQQRPAGGLRRRELQQRGLDGAQRVLGDQGADHVEHRLHRLLRLADQPEDRAQGQHGREDGQHAVVGQGGGEVGALVVAELAPHLAGDVPPGPLLDVRRIVGLARVLRVGRGGLGAVEALGLLWRLGVWLWVSGRLGCSAGSSASPPPHQAACQDRRADEADDGLGADPVS